MARKASSQNADFIESRTGFQPVPSGDPELITGSPSHGSGELFSLGKGRIYAPACGSGSMFVQSEKFVESHSGKLGDISVYGQDKWARRQQPKQSNPTTRRLAIMNLALRGIEADFGPENADTFRRDLHFDVWVRRN